MGIIASYNISKKKRDRKKIIKRARKEFIRRAGYNESFQTKLREHLIRNGLKPQGIPTEIWVGGYLTGTRFAAFKNPGDGKIYTNEYRKIAQLISPCTVFNTGELLEIQKAYLPEETRGIPIKSGYVDALELLATLENTSGHYVKEVVEINGVTVVKAEYEPLEIRIGGKKLKGYARFNRKCLLLQSINDFAYELGLYNKPGSKRTLRYYLSADIYDRKLRVEGVTLMSAPLDYYNIIDIEPIIERFALESEEFKYFITADTQESGKRCITLTQKRNMSESDFAFVNAANEQNKAAAPNTKESLPEIKPAVPAVTEQSTEIKTPVLEVTEQFPEIKTPVLEVKEQFPEIKAPVLEVTEQFPEIKTPVLEVKEQFPEIKTPVLEVKEPVIPTFQEGLPGLNGESPPPGVYGVTSRLFMDGEQIASSFDNGFVRALPDSKINKYFGAHINAVEAAASNGDSDVTSFWYDELLNEQTIVINREMKKSPIRLTRKGNLVNIRANIIFTGSAAEKKPEGSDKTVTDIIKEGLKTCWHGKFFDNNDIKLGTPYVDVSLELLSNVNEPHITWKIEESGDKSIASCEFEKGVITATGGVVDFYTASRDMQYSPAQLAQTAAHIFGHILGLADTPPPAPEPGMPAFGSLMSDTAPLASAKDMKAVLNCFVTNQKNRNL